MFKGKKRAKTSYGIVGLGRFGAALAEALIYAGADIMVLDSDEEKVREFREYTENAMVVRSLDKKTLAETGIQNCDVAVVCIGSQMDTSILTTLHLVSLGVPIVVSKATSPEHGEILEKIGAEVVYPERDMAIRLANRLESSRVVDFMQLSETLNISKISVPKKIVGKSIIEINFRVTTGLNIIAIENGGSVIENVRPEYVFRDGDNLIVSGSRENLLKLAEDDN